MIRIDETTRLVPNLDARMLVSIKLGIDIPPSLTLNINEETFVYPIEMLGGLNACFLCKKEGHLQKNCPIINRRNHKPNINSTDASTNPRTKIFQHSSTPLPVNEEAAIPITNSSELKPMHIDHTPLVSDQLSPASDPTIGPSESPSDCFQLVTSRKRRRKISNLNAPNLNHPTIPTTSQVTSICNYPLPTNNSSPAPARTLVNSIVKKMVKKLENPSRSADVASTNDNPACVMIRSKTPKNLDSSSPVGLTLEVNITNPSTASMLKELEDNHVIEVIYANKGLEEIRSSTVLLGFPDSQMFGSDIGGIAATRNEPSNISEDEDNLMKGPSLTKKKGRPMGSKNKKKSGDPCGLPS